MNRLSLGVFLLASSFGSASQVLAQSGDRPLALTNVTVIDVAQGVAVAARTVVLEGDRITAVGAANEVEVPAGAAVVDGTGKFLIPGLWDMHAHSWEESIHRDIFLPLYVAHGVTGIREMSGEHYELEARGEVAGGTLLGPRMLVSSPIVDGPNPLVAEGKGPRVADADEARRAVEALHAQGYDLIQTHQFLSPAAYRAIHERAREIGIEVSGTIPISVSLWEAAALGHRTVEHLWGVELACSSREEELRVDYRQQVEEISADTSLGTHVAVWTRTELEPLRSIDPTKCRALYRHLAANETWVVPTLLIQRLMAYGSDAALQNDPRQRYLPGPGWAVEEYADFYDPERRLRATYEHRLRTLVDLHRAGVGILAGSEVQAGFSLHDELALYVEGGLTPLEALRTATLNPARYLNATDSLGTVEAGKLADLVLLDANPLEDISNTQRISAVVLNGRYLDRRELEALLAQAEAASDASRVSSDVPQVQPSETNLSPETWQATYDDFESQLSVVPTQTPVASGDTGAVAVGYYGLAAQAGLEALQRGGTAIDAALTTALTQIALDGGSVISYFGVMALVYYDAETGAVHTMNAGWNSVLGEQDPLSIPGGPPMADGRLTDIEPSGRTALVGGFMKGVESAHQRFGRLPFSEVFQPAIHVAREGFPVSGELAGMMALRVDDLARLPETAATFLKPDGQPYGEGEGFRQPALARTLAAVASQGSDYMYAGDWGERLVAAVQGDGGSMTMEDLESYEVVWNEPLTAPVGGYVVHTMPPPTLGGVLMIEAQNLAVASGLTEEPHWTDDASSLRKAVTIAQASMMLDFMSDERFAELYPGLERTDSARLTPEWAEALWARMEAGALPVDWREQDRKYSDVVVVADARGNVAALAHSINTVMWGKTAITVDGITISDAGSFLQRTLAAVEPGARVPDPSQVGILTKNGRAVLGFASKGGGMHHRPFQGLISFVHHGMSVGDAVAAPDFFVAARDADTGAQIMRVPAGRFPQRVLDGTGWAYREVPLHEARAGGEGVWVAVTRDPLSGRFTAASNTRSNSAAVAYE